MRVAVIIPCHNERLTIASLVADCRRHLPEASIWVFDNLSTDGTADVARLAGARVVPSLRKGKGHVVRHMFDQVEADYYIMLDGDGTYDPAEARSLLSTLIATHADMVVGSRLKTFEGESFRRFHQFGNRFISSLISRLFQTSLEDVLSGYRVFSRAFVKSVPLRTGGFEIETELTLQALVKGFRVVEAPIAYGVRPDGSESKLRTYRDGFFIFRLIAWIFKDYKPLLFFTGLSLVLALVSLAVGYGPVLEFVRERYVYRVPSAILAAALGILAALSFGVGLVLDTVSKYQLENFENWRKLRLAKHYDSSSEPRREPAAPRQEIVSVSSVELLDL